MIVGGLTVILRQAENLVVLLFFNMIGGGVFCTATLGSLEVSEITLDITGGDAIPGGYMKTFRSLELYTGDCAVDISGF